MSRTSKAWLASTALLFLAAGSASAQDTFEWTNAASDQLWSNAGNWSMNGGAASRYPGNPAVPGADADIVIIPQTGFNPIVDAGTLATPVVVAAISIPSSDSVTMTFNSNVALATDTLEMNQSSYLSFSQASGSSGFAAELIHVVDPGAVMDIAPGVMLVTDRLLVDASADLTFMGSIAANDVDVLGTALVIGSIAGDGALSIAAAAAATVDGIVELGHPDSALYVNADTTFSGNGAIVGSYDSAQLIVAASKTATLEVPAEGTLEFQGSGTLANRSVITANTGDIRFGENLVLNDGPTTDVLRWYANGHQMEFHRQHTASDALAGRFKAANGGSYYFDESITTAGTFVRPVNNVDTNYSSCPGSPVISGASGVTFNWAGLGSTLCSF